MYKKQFSPSDFEASDKFAKDTAIKCLLEYNPGSRCVVNPYSEFGVDLIFSLPIKGEVNLFTPIMVEVEHRKSWKGKWCLGDRVRIPGRKMKFQGCAFFIINNEGTHGIFIHPDTKYNLTFATTRYSDNEEMFMVFNLKDCELVDI